MCAMALIHSRIRRVYYSIPNETPNAGGINSKTMLNHMEQLNHKQRVFRFLLYENNILIMIYKFVFISALLILGGQAENNIFLDVIFETGLINLTDTSDIFYWYFPSQRDNTTDPLTIWLNGGPGCSSTFALFNENGPFTINNDSTTLSKNPYSWST